MRSLPLLFAMAGTAAAAPKHPRAFVWTMLGDNARLGVQLQDMTEDLRKYFGAPADEGVLVARVDPDSPAAKAGLRAGDVVLAIDGQKVEESGDVIATIAEKDAGAKTSIVVLRDKRQQTVTATLGARGKPFEFHSDGSGTFQSFGFDFGSIEKLRSEIRDLQQRIEKLEAQRK